MTNPSMVHTLNSIRSTTRSYLLHQTDGYTAETVEEEKFLNQLRVEPAQNFIDYFQPSRLFHSLIMIPPVFVAFLSCGSYWKSISNLILKNIIMICLLSTLSVQSPFLLTTVSIYIIYESLLHAPIDHQNSLFLKLIISCALIGCSLLLGGSASIATITLFSGIQLTLGSSALAISAGAYLAHAICCSELYIRINERFRLGWTGYLEAQNLLKQYINQLDLGHSFFNQFYTVHSMSDPISIVKMANKLLFHQSITLDPKVSSLNTPQSVGPTPSGELDSNIHDTCHSQAQTATPASQESHTEIVSDDFDSPITTANFQKLRQSLNQFPDVDYVSTFSSQIIQFLKSKQNAHVDPSQTASLINIIDITLPSLSDERFVQLNSHLGNMLPASGSETGSARISRVASAYQTEINSTTDTVNLDNIYAHIHQELVSVMIAITTFQSDFDIDITPLVNVVKSAPVKASTRISGYEATDFLSRSQDPVKICFFVLLAYTGYLIGTRLEDNELIAQSKDKITTFHSQLNQVTSSVRHNFSAMTGINSNQQAVEVVKKIVDKTNSTSVQNTYN